MALASHSVKPKFRNAEVWGACARCGARVRYATLQRERLTGLLVCTPASGRPVKSCLDPWPEVYDFQAYSDKSTDPPPEPMPARWNLDDLWGSGANPKAAPDDATRLANIISSVPYYARLGKSAAFDFRGPTLDQQIATAVNIVPADWDGTFLPSGSVRTVKPQQPTADDVSSSDVDLTAKLWGPPAAAVRKV